MLKTSRKNSRKRVAVIKNEHSKAQMSQLDNEWVNHNGPYMTLKEVMAQERTQQDTQPGKSC